MSEQHPPARVRVTAPQRVQPRRRRTAAAEIDAQSELGEIYLSSLLRSQLRPALLVLAALTVIGGGLPLLFALVPSLREITLLGMPLPWLVLGVGVYPVFWLLGWLYLRSAERNEADFAEAVER
ncbi:hypothetical protein GCM10027425_27700 [Alteromonas gracilis]